MHRNSGDLIHTCKLHRWKCAFFSDSFEASRGKTALFADCASDVALGSEKVFFSQHNEFEQWLKNILRIVENVLLFRVLILEQLSIITQKVTPSLFSLSTQKMFVIFQKVTLSKSEICIALLNYYLVIFCFSLFRPILREGAAWRGAVQFKLKFQIFVSRWKLSNEPVLECTCEHRRRHSR